jgi:hypothetical protein
MKYLYMTSLTHYFCTAEEPDIGDREETVMEERPPVDDQQILMGNQSPAEQADFPTAEQPNTDAGPSSIPPVPDRLADMLLALGTSFRHVQNIPEFDPEQMIDWMNSSLASMNKVCIWKMFIRRIRLLLLILCCCTDGCLRS